MTQTMKHILLLAALLSSWSLTAQFPTPVTWTMSHQQVDKETFDLLFKAKINQGWYVYSNHLAEGGPEPTTFTFDSPSAVELVGAVKEKSSHRKEGFDDIFEMNVIKYAQEVTFVQRVRVKEPGRTVTGYLTFMTCDDTQCLPPTEVDFSFDLPAAQATAPKAETPASAADAGPAAPETPATAGKVSRSNAFREPGSPLEWTAELRPLSNAGDYELSFTAQIDEGWYTYSMFLEADGPIPTGIYFEPAEAAQRLGKGEESGPRRIQEHDPNFDMELVKFKEQATFRQKIRLTTPGQPVSGYLEFMACNASSCLPPVEVPFRIDPQGPGIVLGNENAIMLQPETDGPAAANGLQFDLPDRPDLDNPVGQCSTQSTFRAGGGYWNIFLLGFLGGLLALLTPCVFPMIPLTVSFFTKSGGSRRKGMTNAFLYGFFIFLVYLLLSLPFHLMDSINPDILNDISTNVWLNILFFVIFVVFAFSFFGYYELTLPSSWANKAASAEGIGGIVGIFFMALTLALVSFSCTGPILGSLLAGTLTSDGGAWQLSAGMSGFGLALALPFALFAAFPSLMNAIPKSGGWLTTVKVTLGFLELALAMKFLSNADLVKHWGVLRIEPFLVAWILIFLSMGLYYLGVIRFPHDTPSKKWSAGRIGMTVLSFGFALYLASGLRYNPQIGAYPPLTLLSGLAPPAGYSFFHPSDCPQNLNCFKDLNDGLAYARKVNKPVMLDFTGYACVNCRKMEEHVWPKNQVYAQLKDDYVLISLYVDDKRELPAEEQIEVPGRSRPLRTYGNKWSYFQNTYFQAATQPFYVLISPDGQLLNAPVGYTPDSDKYAQFLSCGIDAFEKLAENTAADNRLGERVD